ncbi:F-box protein skip19 [Thalictrum thalictroides]|uniref:F-box protein skip19 n=1 Tax=Thalictrum thalictroides TaxID=46969 RepID=A0A7J6UUA7_THATH|nr:F-box protein skip19 [Thalictrum thalictroides]
MKKRRNLSQFPVRTVRTRQSSKEEAMRKLLDLPPEVMLMIFMKLGAFDILYSIPLVCSTWRKITQDPQAFSVIDLRDTMSYFWKHDHNLYTKFVKNLVDKSCGELMKIYISDLGTNELLQYIVSNTNKLVSLRIVHCDIYDDGLLEAFTKKFPLLEELELRGCFDCTKQVIEAVGRSCPQLKYFRYNFDDFCPPIKDEEFACALAKNMPQLRRLQLYGNTVLTNNDLKVILKSCVHLDYLDLRRCRSININEVSLKKSLSRIKTVKLPHDFTAGWFDMDSEMEDAASEV